MKESLSDVWENGEREYGEVMLRWETQTEFYPDENNKGTDDYKITTHYVVVGPSGKVLISLTIKW